MTESTQLSLVETIDAQREQIRKMREALELARTTIVRLAVKHGPFSSVDGTLDVIHWALK